MSTREYSESDYIDALEYAVQQAEDEDYRSEQLNKAIGCAKQGLGQGIDTLSEAQQGMIHSYLGRWTRAYFVKLDRDYCQELLRRDTPP